MEKHHSGSKLLWINPQLMPVSDCLEMKKKSLSFKFEDNMIKFSLQNIKLQINSTKLWAVSRSFNFVMKKCKLE